ncbi:MAG: DUF2255 family protein [Myxococcota bacterium]
MVRSFPSFVSIAACLLALALTAHAAHHGDHAESAAAPPPDWADVAAVEEIEVLTHDEDGALRETTIWLAVVDGEGFVRTGGSSWGQNLERDPTLVLRIEGEEFPLRAEFIEDESLRERVTETFREKYGFSDVLITPIRGSNPMIMRMLPRDS